MAGPDLASGTLIGARYRLERLLGEGGMGVVWAAEDLTTHQHHALKFLKRDAGDPDARRRFLREARAASAVRHPHVVSILDVLELPDGSPVIVMELLEGESLRQRLARERRIPLGELAEIAVPVISAVGAAHALGIVHRDLKPENIFLSRGAAGERVVKVLDFGIAKLTALDGEAMQSTGITTGAVLGTPAYMAPEQVFAETDVDHRADIWSLGLILYQCLSGVLPTEGDNVPHPALGGAERRGRGRHRCRRGPAVHAGARGLAPRRFRRQARVPRPARVGRRGTGGLARGGGGRSGSCRKRAWRSPSASASAWAPSRSWCGGRRAPSRCRIRSGRGHRRAPSGHARALRAGHPRRAQHDQRARARRDRRRQGGSGAHRPPAVAARQGPFLELNCAALPPSLLEAELFGHEKSASTGANQARAGLLESADQGTIFLDEVGELPLPVQSKLLRVLEDRKVMRIGGCTPRKLDVRFVAATNRDLEAEVAGKTFREDLYFRLNGVSFTIPPLRERIAEIAPLAERFLAAAGQTLDRIAGLRLSPDALGYLEHHAWPATCVNCAT